ncbi:MAG: hypothetical protein HKM04_06180 [Legionellales bacterium]|nr:hypothetical protein [Legionellales bacterium]
MNQTIQHEKTIAELEARLKQVIDLDLQYFTAHKKSNKKYQDEMMNLAVLIAEKKSKEKR